jgi:phage terminase small subunit
MPRKGERWTASERVFVNNMAKTGDKTYSATKAGYKQPHVVGHIVAAKPAIQAEIARQQQEILFREALPAAVKCLIDIATDVKAAAGARVQASKVILDRTLGASEAMGGKEAHEMTAEEIAKAIEQLQRVAADRAKPVIELEVSSIDEQQLDEAENPDIFG